jgi:hypothetical protein
MITEPQPHMIVLQLTNALLAQLRPFMTDLAISATPHSHLDDQEISAQSHVACDASVEQGTQQLTMRGEVYDALVARVGDALDYDVRWQPNEHEPDGFVERVRPLELMGGSDVPADCPQSGALLLDNRAAMMSACSQTFPLI